MTPWAEQYSEPVAGAACCRTISCSYLIKDHGWVLDGPLILVHACSPGSLFQHLWVVDVLALQHSIMWESRTPDLLQED